MRPLPRAVLPSALVPMRLPAITLFSGRAGRPLSIRMPAVLFPAMTLPSAASLFAVAVGADHVVVAAKNNHAVTRPADAKGNTALPARFVPR